LPEQHKQPNKRGFESSDELGQRGHAYKMRARLVREENHLIHTRACTHPISTSTFERMSQHISILMKFTINTSSSMCTCIAYLYNGQTLATNTGAFPVSFETIFLKTNILRSLDYVHDFDVGRMDERSIRKVYAAHYICRVKHYKMAKVKLSGGCNKHIMAIMHVLAKRYSNKHLVF
jgi:hypothetical protein